MADQYMVFVPGSASPPQGPLTLAELQSAVQAEQIPGNAKISRVGDTSWKPIHEVVPLRANRPEFQAPSETPTWAEPDGGEDDKTVLQPALSEQEHRDLFGIGPDVDARFEVTVDGENIVGPVTLDQLRRGVEVGKLPRDAKARVEGTEAWRSALQLIDEEAAKPTDSPTSPRLPDVPGSLKAVDSAGRPPYRSRNCSPGRPGKSVPAQTAPLAPGTALPARLPGGRRVWWLLGGVPVFILLVAVLLWPSAGARALSRGRSLAEKGQWADALVELKSVCTLTKDIATCGEARAAAAQVRIRLAEDALKAQAFGMAGKILNDALADTPSSARRKIEELKASKELVEGMRWEKAITLADKHAALTDIEKVADAQVSVSPAAQEWLSRERPRLLLVDATTTCKGGSFERCKAVIGRLADLHPASPEAERAQKLLREATAQEAQRVGLLLAEAEKLLSTRASLKRTEKKREDCYLRELASNPDNALAAVYACGGNQPKDMKGAEQAETSWKALMAKMNDPAQAQTLEERWRAASEDGEYQKPSSRSDVEKKIGPAATAAAPVADTCGCEPADLACAIRCARGR